MGRGARARIVGDPFGAADAIGRERRRRRGLGAEREREVGVLGVVARRVGRPVRIARGRAQR
eukprot:5233642-Prymnesium_polylepis.1